MYEERMNRLREILRGEGLDAFAVIPGFTMLYLTGISFHLMERPIVLLIMPDEPATFVVPGMERLKAESTTIEADITDYGEDFASRDQTFKTVGGKFDRQGFRIGYEPLSMRAFELGLLQNAFPNASFSPRSDVTKSLRLSKDKEELAAHRQAVKIAETALENTLPAIKKGMAESELAAELVIQTLREGSEPDLPFFPIVGFGPNSALPHYSTGDRPLKPGDAILIDYGARYKGYVSDITRVFVFGEASKEFEKVHKTVCQANAAGVLAVRPGGACGEVDRATRKVIEEAGFGEFLRHRTGHGIGLDVHEEPYIRLDNEEAMRPGMVFTIEPGLYFPGKYGVRIEDNVHVTQSGCEVLTSFPRELQSLQ